MVESGSSDAVLRPAQNPAPGLLGPNESIVCENSMPDSLATSTRSESVQWLWSPETTSREGESERNRYPLLVWQVKRRVAYHWSQTVDSRHISGDLCIWSTGCVCIPNRFCSFLDPVVLGSSDRCSCCAPSERRPCDWAWIDIGLCLLRLQAPGDAWSDVLCDTKHLEAIWNSLWRVRGWSPTKNGSRE